MMMMPDDGDGSRRGMETMMMRMTQIMHALKNKGNESKYMYLYP